MQSLFRQTRMKSPAAEKRSRERGLTASARAAAAIQLGAQLLLWITFFGYDQTEQTVWQAALLLLLPLLTLWLVWRIPAAEQSCARWWTLPLWLCLLLDSVLALTALAGYMTQLVPLFPLWVCAAVPLTVCYLTVLRSGRHGVWYSSAVMAVPLVILLFFGTVFLRASTRADRLWPLLGNGWLSTARSALLGAGSVWGGTLVLALPNRHENGKTWDWLLVPWALCVLWALWFGFVRPWAAGDTLAAAEKMMGLARHADSVLLYETAGLMWMLLLPATLTAAFSSAECLLSRALPRMPRWAALGFLPLGTFLLTLFSPQGIFSFLPYRYVIALVCGLGLRLAAWRRK